MIYTTLVPVVAIIVCYFVVTAINKPVIAHGIQDLFLNINKPGIVLRIVFFGLYLAQLAYYINVFIKEKQKYNRRINNYFSNTNTLNLKWVEQAFGSLLLVAFAAIVIVVFPNLVLNLVFTALLNVFYLLYALKYLNYLKVFNLIEPHIEKIFDKHEETRTSGALKNNWALYKETIIAKGLYKVKGITLENIAQQLLIGRTTLSSLINNEEGVNFNAWINQLRIDYAKNIIIEHPEYTMSQVADLSGFTEVSNFSRQFKLVTNKPPSIWKKTISKNSSLV